MAPERIVVVGASLAGVRAGEALRRLGFDGELTVLGSESHLPYDRPPLSKQVLDGRWEPAKATLRIDDGIRPDLHLGVTAAGVDLDRRRVLLEGGEDVPFDGLVIATGAAPRTLPGTEGLAGVHVLRTLDDCVSLRADLDHQPRVAVIGAGFIGSEVAAAARRRGLDTTVIEALDLPLLRILGPEMGAVCAAVHRDNGTSLRLGVGVAGIEGNGRAERVRMADGTAVDADVVVVGIGVTPATAWLDGSGLALDNGVVADETLRAADGVYVAGDVARWPSRRFGQLMRVEHWSNAAAMGDHVAAAMLGHTAAPFDPIPYFWSDQYDRKIQFVGHVSELAPPIVTEGSTDDRKFAAVYVHDGAVTAAITMNMPARLVHYENLVGTPWPPAG